MVNCRGGERNLEWADGLEMEQEGRRRDYQT